MAVLQPEDLTAQQWTWLVTTLRSEMATGRITACKDVRESLSLWTEYVPAIGVQLMDVKEDQNSTARHIVLATFAIQVSTQSTQATATANGYEIANLDDAMGQLRALVSDGAGNGVAPILRDPSYRSLGGNAATSRITGIHFQPDVRPGADPATNDPEIWAHAFIDFVTTSPVAIN